MIEIFRNITRYLGIFAVTLLCCVMLLLLVCKIPQSAIEANSRKSAEYLVQKEAFPLALGRFLNTRGDNYADSNLLNVIYNIDSQNAFQSMIEASYYRVDGESAQENFYETVVEEQAPNMEYSRYWHGSQVLIRPLLMLMSVSGIRVAMFCLLLLLNLWLAGCLLRQKQFDIACIYGGALIISGFWMTAFSLEYVMTFLVMTAACIAVVYICKCGNEEKKLQDRKLIGLLIAVGVITSFLDFLTTETLTFTIPMLLFLFLRKKQNCLESFREEFVRMLKAGIAWIFSYGAMFVMKWGLISVTLGRFAFEKALQSAVFRMEGSVAESGKMGQQITGALLRNLACLFPVTEDVSSVTVPLMTFGILAVLGALCYLFRKDPVDVTLIGLLIFIAIIPYGRFVCLSNHSYIHYFFAYRAQMASVMALLGILWNCIWPMRITIYKRK